jgi:hypothetical protein
MMRREEIKAVYDQGPEAVIALIEQLCTQIAQLSERVKELEDRLATTSIPAEKFVYTAGGRTNEHPAVAQCHARWGSYHFA